MFSYRNLFKNLTKAWQQPGYALEVLRKRGKSYLTYLLRDGQSSYPETVSFFLTHRCNLRCRMCGRWGEKGSSREYAESLLASEMTLKDYRRLLDDLSSFRPNITLFGGEPLVYDGVLELISEIKVRGMRVNMVTNGVYFEKMAGGLVEAGLDEAIISLDGPPEIHDRIRGIPGTFAKIMSGLDRLEDVKKKLGKKKPFIAFTATISSMSYRYLPQIARIAARRKVCYVSFHHLIHLEAGTYEAHERLYRACFGRGTPDWAGFVLPEGVTDIDIDELVSIVRYIKNTQFGVPAFFYPDFPENELRKYYSRGYFISRAFPKRCLSPWMTVYIFPDGEVRPCLNMEAGIGNVKKTPFTELWNNERFVYFRHILKKEKFFPVCTKCTEFYRF